MIKSLLLGTAAALALIACNDSDSTVTPKSQDVAATSPTLEMNTAEQSAKLNAWFEDKFMENARHYPTYLASLGIDERTDEWNDTSREFSMARLEDTKRNLADMRASFDYESLNTEDQLSYRLWEYNAERSIAGEKWWDHGYTFTQMFGPHTSLPTFLINQHKVLDSEDVEHYIVRLETMDDVLRGNLKNAIASFDLGIAPPKYVYDYVIESSGNILKGSPVEDVDELNLLLKNLKTKADKIDMDDETREALYARAVAAIENDIAPAYRELITEMERQKAVASTDDGVWKLPDGDAFYAHRLKVMTTTDLTASEIHDLGLADVKRIHGEMRDIMKQVGFDGTLQEFFEFTRTGKQFFKPETKTGKAAYLREATDLIDTMSGRLPEVFHRLPKAPLEVRAVEAFREKAAGKAFYNAPTPDGSRPGIYYANLYRMDAMPTYQMEALAYHEGVPGHHMQIAISRELEGVPQFRKFGRYTPYSEGWGLYSEYLPKEMGFYEDPYSDFGRLAMELWRAARLVVDTGLHDKKWSREKAIEYLVTNTPNPEYDCLKAIERYIVMPGQATAYKIGMMKILELREGAKSELGPEFDIRDFHDVFLASGPVPLDILEERVEAYVADKKG